MKKVEEKLQAFQIVASAHGEPFTNFVLDAKDKFQATIMAEKIIDTKFYYSSYTLSVTPTTWKLATIYSVTDTCSSNDPSEWAVKQMNYDDLIEHLNHMQDNDEAREILFDNPTFDQLDELAEGVGLLLEVIRP